MDLDAIQERGEAARFAAREAASPQPDITALVAVLRELRMRALVAETATWPDHAHNALRDAVLRLTGGAA